jgi:integrase
MYPDGAGLYLQVTTAAWRSWVYRFMLRGHAREMGLGPLSLVSLAEARSLALDARKLRLAGIDPIDAKRDQRGAAALEAAKAITFRACAEAYIEAHKAGWRNAKHADQWAATLTAYAFPIIGEVAAHAVDVAMVTKILEPIWKIKTETASRVRGRIESVLDWATSRGYRKGDNPARWRGHLENLLPARSKVRKVEHRPALPYTEIGAFMVDLHKHAGTAAAAMDFTILTAARTAETIGARWSEIDFDASTWTIPADRIKAGREHRVPLSTATVAVLREQQRQQRIAGEVEFVFPGDKRGQHLSNMAMLALLQRMGRDDVTVHGFRSTFRDWAAERTNFPREVAEAALAHVVDDKVEAAYRRTDLFDKRRRLMDAWAKFCATVKAAGEVVTLTRAGRQ